MYNDVEIASLIRSQTQSIRSGNTRNKSKGKARIPLAMMKRSIEHVQHFESRRLAKAKLVEPGVLRRRS